MVRVRLKNGKLIPPRSVAEGKTRLAQLHAECRKIQRQLASTTMPVNVIESNDGRSWRERADKALGILTSEAEQLEAWLRDQDAAMPRAALQTVRVLLDEVDDLSPTEKRSLEWLASRLRVEVEAIRAGVPA